MRSLFTKGNLKVFNHNFPPVLPGGFPVTGIGECDFHVTVRHGRRDFHCSAAGCHIGSFVPLCSVYLISPPNSPAGIGGQGQILYFLLSTSIWQKYYKHSLRFGRSHSGILPDKKAASVILYGLAVVILHGLMGKYDFLFAENICHGRI